MAAVATLLALSTVAFVHAPYRDYEARKVVGYDVRISPAARDRKELGPALTLLEGKLRDLNTMIPEKALAQIRHVPIFLEDRNPKVPCACYHPSANWLARNGFITEKEGAIEIGHLGRFVDWTQKNQPQMVLHEMAHAYHHQVLGFRNQDIKLAYLRAKAKGLYGRVPYSLGGERDHYAMTDEREYFAELTEAYFGGNDFYPFHREQLRAYDPEGLAVVEKVWGLNRSVGLPASDGLFVNALVLQR